MRRFLSIVARVVGVIVVGSCSVEAVHNFIWFAARAKQGEAKQNLRALCLSQRALLSQNQPSATFRGLGVELERNRYAYFISPGPELEHPDHSTRRPEVRSLTATGVQTDLMMAPRVLPTDADVPPLLGGLKLGANGGAWVMVALGDIDTDPELDAWSVSTEARVKPDGVTLEPCVPYLEHSDVPPGPIRRLFR